MAEDNKTKENLEVFFDVFDESCSYLYEILKANYFDLILLTAKNILAGEVLNDLEPEQVKKLEKIYEPLANVDFDVEEIRKAMQAQVLKGIKEMRLENGLATPDTIGIFIAYLVSRLNQDKKTINIVDPLLGTGNLLYTICNHLSIECNLYGCDHNEWMTKMAKVIADLMNQPIDIYLQDTLNLNLRGMDFVVFDMPNLFEDKKDYFPYKAVLHYLTMLNDEGFLIGVVGNDFFDYDKEGLFKKNLTADSTIIGIVELPDNFFVNNPKSIIVIQKKIWEEKKCFMVKLPSFTDVKAFNKELMSLESWFNTNIMRRK